MTTTRGAHENPNGTSRELDVDDRSTTGADARHEVTNTLVRYLRAVDEHDLEGVLAELAHAEVSFGGPPARGNAALRDAYQEAFKAGGRTRHFIHEVEVRAATAAANAGAHSTQQVIGWAAYQRWTLESEPPTLTALGAYQARFALTDGRLRLTSLSVRRDWTATTPPIPPLGEAGP
jgi:hypothetical protein